MLDVVFAGSIKRGGRKMCQEEKHGQKQFTSDEQRNKYTQGNHVRLYAMIC